jgi:nitroreductase
MRRLRTDPVPTELLLQLVDAGIRAPSSNDAQNWWFVIVQDGSVKRALAEEFRKGIRWKASVSEVQIESELARGRIDGVEAGRRRRMQIAADHLADHFEDTPALICACITQDTATTWAALSWRAMKEAVRQYGLIGTLRFVVRARSLSTQAMWASAYPAVQNILLAARALGLGAVLTAPHLLGPPGRLEAILGLPREVRLAALIPVGYPKGRFGPVRRRPIQEHVYWDRYGD